MLLVIILMEGFARRQLILAVDMHHARLKMVLLSIRKVVFVERVIALLLQMICFVRRQQIRAVIMQRVPLKMVFLSILTVVLVERVTARLPMVCFARCHSILATSMHHALLPVVSL